MQQQRIGGFFSEVKRMTEPSTTKTNGRFQPGNKAAVGHQTKSQKLRHAIMAAISQADVKEIVKSLVDKAKGGDIDACKILFKFIGPPQDKPTVAIQNNVGPSRTVHNDPVLRGIVARIKQHNATEATPRNPVAEINDRRAAISAAVKERAALAPADEAG